MNKLITTAALALASAALFETAVKAQASQGDLILGFQTSSTTATGHATDVVIDLGADTLFTGIEGTGDVINLTSGDQNAGTIAAGYGNFNVSDLSVYGSSAVNFGVAGTDVGYEILVTGLSAQTQQNSQGTQAGVISPLYTGFDNGSATSSGDTGVTESTTATGAYTKQVGNNGTLGNNFHDIQTGVPTSGSVSLNLYDLNQGTGTGPGTLVGAFNLTSAGVLTFDASSPAIQAVPEPSTYALFGLGALVMIIAARRRKMMQS